MRASSDRPERSTDLRRRLLRPLALPVRAETARTLLAVASGRCEPGDELRRLTAIDPGWAWDELTTGRNPADRLSELAWWPLSARGVEPLGRLWRHAVASSRAARRMAAEGGRGDIERVGRLALLHRLGEWALAAADLDSYAAVAGPTGGVDREAARRRLGVDLNEVGCRIAEHSGDADLADVVRLTDSACGELVATARDPELITLLRRAVSWADRTPWALAPSGLPDPAPTDPRIRLLIAEVQARCPGDFVAGDATAIEERLSREHAALLRRHRELEGRVADQERFVAAFLEAGPAEAVEDWADRAALAWCGKPGVTAARVVWHGKSAKGEADADVERIPLGDARGPVAEIQLRREASAGVVQADSTVALWGRWAEWVSAVAGMRRRLDTSTAIHAERLRRDEAGREAERLDALAEFAAGAGHELNNPLAVVLGRAQLLLGAAQDAETARALRAIIGQARRAHRIVRDLMYVARPSAPRSRPCQPDEILRAAVRDLQPEADARGIRLVPRLGEEHARGWLDPDGLRQLADVLIRNALEATPAGGAVQVAGRLDDGGFEWTVSDGGRGLDAGDARHLLDPFYCGRQAGRGLGLGLPRAARFLKQIGGELDWRSSPGHGSIFRVRLPLPGEPARPEAAPTERA